MQKRMADEDTHVKFTTEMLFKRNMFYRILEEIIAD